jgi:hypothetical protein
MRKRPQKPADVPANPRTKKSKSAQDVLEKYFRPLVSAVNGGSFSFMSETADDTTVVLTATSFLDYLLKLAVVERFRRASDEAGLAEIFDGYGPLGTFDAKIRLCSALGLVVIDMRDGLVLIKKIRNDFARGLSR